MENEERGEEEGKGGRKRRVKEGKRKEKGGEGTGEWKERERRGWSPT